MQKLGEIQKISKRTVLTWGGAFLALLLFFLPSMQAEASGTTYIDNYGTWTYTLDSNNATITGYSGAESAIEIPSEVSDGSNSYPVTAVGKSSSVFSGTNITSVTIPDSVTSIGVDAFYNCTNLSSVTIHGAATIGDGAFKECTNLNSVSMQNVTKIGDNAFASCTNLESVTMNKVTSIGDGAFASCTSLKNITIPDSVTTIGDYAFLNINLSSIIIPDSVTSIGNNAFAGCQNLSSVTINGAATIGTDAFLENGTLSSVTINGAATIGANAFASCNGLSSVTMNKVTSIGYGAFASCTSLKNITIPDSVTSIGDSAFNGCSGLSSITIPDSVTTIGDKVFDGCTNLTNITVTSEATKKLVEAALEDSDIKESVTITIVEPTAPSTTTTTTPTTTYIPPAWVPTEAADIFRYSLYGSHIPDYKVVLSTDSIYMERAVQGPLFFKAVALIQGDYTLARSYNIFVNNDLLYYNGNSTKITLQIPETLQKEGRTFRMFCVTEDGKVSSLKDLDKDPTTITFETNQFYAFALAYVD